jgi:hypothetical protein
VQLFDMRQHTCPKPNQFMNLEKSTLRSRREGWLALLSIDDAKDPVEVIFWSGRIEKLVGIAI